MPIEPDAYPEPEATVDASAGASELVVATLRSVRQIRTRWARYQKIARLKAYFDGTQYEGRPYNWDGSYAQGSAVVGEPTYPNFLPALSDRKPPSNYPIGRTIVERLTSMLFGEERFPQLEVPDDPDSQDFVRGISEAVDLPRTMAGARDMGGAATAVILSWAWLNGAPIVETHSPIDCICLEWENAKKQIPRHVLKVWSVPAPITDKAGLLAEGREWYAREWRGPKGQMAGADVVYRYEPKTPTTPPRWVLNEPPVELDECPVAWINNGDNLDSPEGRADYEGFEGMIDDLNIVLCSTTNGIAINADPTLCILGDQRKAGGQVKKGGYNVIHADAKYLEVSGSSVAAGLQTTDRLRAFAFESGHVAMLDPEKLTGVQSGAAMQQLMYPTTQHCSGLRSFYGDGMARVLKGLLAGAQRSAGKTPPKVRNAEGVEVDASGWAWKLPPIVKKDQNGNIVETAERVPGKGERVIVQWPKNWFSNTPTDDQAAITTLGLAKDAGLASQRTLVERGKPITGVVDVDQELRDIHEDRMRDEEVKAMSLGLGAERGPAAQIKPGSGPDQNRE